MRDVLIWFSIYLGTGAVFWLWEIRDSLRPLNYGSEFFKEIRWTVATLIFSLITAYSVYAFGSILKSLSSPPIMESVAWTGVVSLPLAIRIVIAYVLKDFTYYFLHRATHNNRLLWRAHKFHHSSEEFWWLVTSRHSLLNNLIFTFGNLGILWFTLLEIPPETVAAVGFFEAVFQVWLHLNVVWHPWMGVVEWIFATPRFHAVHHMSRSQIRGKNLGGVFTFFDRLFGTYVNPATLDPNKEEYGLKGESITVRMIVGI